MLAGKRSSASSPASQAQVLPLDRSAPPGERSRAREAPALKARQVAEYVRSALAVEVLVAAQALDFRRPLEPGPGVLAALERVRSRVPFMEEDRPLHRDIEAVSALIDSGELLLAAHRAAG